MVGPATSLHINYYIITQNTYIYINSYTWSAPFEIFETPPILLRGAQFYIVKIASNQFYDNVLVSQYNPTHTQRSIILKIPILLSDLGKINM